MSRRGWFEFGDPVDPADFPQAVAKHIENGTLIKVSDGYRGGQAFDCFYVKDAAGAHIVYIKAAAMIASLRAMMPI